MVREEVGVILTMHDIPDAPEGVYKPSRKRKEVSYKAQKETHKPPKKNDV